MVVCRRAAARPSQAQLSLITVESLLADSRPGTPQSLESLAHAVADSAAAAAALALMLRRLKKP